MKKVLSNLLLTFICIVILDSCASDLNFFSSSKGYKFAYIDDSKDSGGDASLMNFKVQLQQALQSTDLTEVSKEDISNMSDEDKSKLMVLTLSGSQRRENSVATININDYKTNKVLASCNGVFGFGFSTYDDMNGAIKKAIKSFIKYLEQ